MASLSRSGQCSANGSRSGTCIREGQYVELGNMRETRCGHEEATLFKEETVQSNGRVWSWSRRMWGRPFRSGERISSAAGGVKSGDPQIAMSEVI